MQPDDLEPKPPALGLGAEEGVLSWKESALGVLLARPALTTAVWRDTGKEAGGSCRGRFYIDGTNERSAVLKPGFESHGLVEPFREFLAARLAAFLGLRVPAVELLNRPEGPAALSVVPSKVVLTWGQVMDDPTGVPIRATATKALDVYSGIVVLDILVAARDRFNKRNHLYATDREEWFSVDYWQSFERLNDPLTKYREGYRGALIEAAKRSPRIIDNVVDRAMGLGDTAIDALFDLVGEPFVTLDLKREMAQFLKNRRSAIRDLVNDWRERVEFPKVDQ
ncbi:MAG: hypothetical protein JO036_03140 [Candidatus Eremiobacteraeota bacterium]|nr:hypothetical protein [Candidatus Eremiobacteraeota bacterium]